MQLAILCLKSQLPSASLRDAANTWCLAILESGDSNKDFSQSWSTFAASSVLSYLQTEWSVDNLIGQSSDPFTSEVSGGSPTPGSHLEARLDY